MIFVQENSPHANHKNTRRPGKPLPRTGDQSLGWDEVQLGGPGGKPWHNNKGLIEP